MRPRAARAGHHHGGDAGRRGARAEPRTGSSAPGRRLPARRQAVVKAVAAGGTITFDCGPDPVDDRDEADREGRQHEPGHRHRRRRQGHAERRRQAPDPLPEHLRPGAGVDDRPLPGPEGPAARHQGPDLQSRQLDGGDRTRAAVAARSSCAAAGSGCRTRVFDRNRCDRTGPDLGGAAIRVLSVTSAGEDQGQHLHPRQVLQRLRAQQHRRLVEDPRQRVPEEQGGRQGRQPVPPGHPRRRQRRSDLPRRQLLHPAAGPAC